MSNLPKFEYERAFARNLGLVSAAEQSRLRGACVALPGLGGVGGAHIQGLARMGIGGFHLADPDTFDVVNFNRQLGARMETVGINKTSVAAETVLSINPDATIKSFPEGITQDNINDFLDGVDVVVDGIEFFCIAARRMLYRECRSRKIPVVTAGPIGYGAALLVFTAETISFEEFFAIDDSMTRAEQLLAFGLGLGPGLASDLDPAFIDFESEKGPALATACLLCAAVAGTEVLKLVTKRGTLAAAPFGRYIDPLRGQTTPLQPLSLLGKAERDKIRDVCFQRFPALHAMHLREIGGRISSGRLVPVS